MNFFYKKYQRLVIWPVMSLLSSIFLIVTIMTYSMVRDILGHQFGLVAQSVAVAVSLMISEDLDGYREFLKERDVGSEYYQRMQRNFYQIKKTNNIRFIYTINKLDDIFVEFILDAEPVGSPYYSPPGEIAEVTPASQRVFLTKEPAILEPTRLAYGVLLGGSAPIIDENGDLLGVAGVTIDNSVVFSTVKHLFAALVVVCIILLLLVFSLLSKAADFFLESLLKDKLTGAYNKRYFDDILQEHIDIALNLGQDLSVLMLDLDHFKKVNDTYGHIFGDEVLSKVSSWIRNCLRKDDYLIRYGGEEFVVLLINLNSDIAMIVAERIRKAVESSETYNMEENVPVKITISIGVASLRQRRLSSLELISDADKALYKAKETRNAVAVSD